MLAGAMAVCAGAGVVVAVDDGAGAGAGAAGAAAVEGELGVDDEPLPPFWHPPRTSPIQVTAKPITLRFMIFPPDVTT